MLSDKSLNSDTSIWLSYQNDIIEMNPSNCSFTFETKSLEENESLVEALENETLETSFPEEVQNHSTTSFDEFKKQATKIHNNLYKKVLKVGTGVDLDLERMNVTFDYEMFTEFSDKPFDSSFINKRPGSANEQVVPLPGCCEALASMKHQEEAIFWISSSLMFGKLGCLPRVKAEADILFHAKITRVREANNAEDSSEEVGFPKFYKQVLKSSLSARSAYKRSDFHQAIDIYRQSIKKLEDFRLTSDEEETKQRQLLASMYQNISVCYIKIEKPEKTCVMIRELEKLGSIRNNPKALIAKGKAKMMLNDYGFARKYFMMAGALVPGDKGISAAIEDLNSRVETKAIYDAEAAELVRRFQAEATTIEKEFIKKAEEQSKENEELKVQLEKFQFKLEEIIIGFKNDQDVNRLSLCINIIATHHHLQLAVEICERHKIELKGIQSFDTDTINYYLSK